MNDAGQQPESRKKPYASPRLTDFGDVRAVTQGSRGPLADAGGRRKKPKKPKGPKKPVGWRRP